MANKKISQLSANTTITGSELLVIVQPATSPTGNRKLTIDALKAYTSPVQSVNGKTGSVLLTATDFISLGVQYQIPSINAAGSDFLYGACRFDTVNNRFYGGSTHTIAGSQNFTWGDQNNNAGTFGSAIFGELSKIDAGVGAALNAGENNYIGAYGGSAFGRGCKVGASGQYAQIGGWYSPSSINGESNDKAPMVNAQAAFGFYETDASQTIGHGVSGQASAVVGGRNPNIPASSPRCFIGGGNGIKARASESDQAYFPAININNIPSEDNTLYQTLVRDHSATGGPVRYRYDQASTYTPTLTNVANLDSTTAYTCQYIKMGNVVTFSGKITADPTNSLIETNIGISLPFASNISAEENCAGVGFTQGADYQGAVIVGDTINDRAELQFIAPVDTSIDIFFTCTYRIA